MPVLKKIPTGFCLTAAKPGGYELGGGFDLLPSGLVTVLFRTRRNPKGRNSLPDIVPLGRTPPAL